MSNEIFIDPDSDDCYIEPTIPVSFEVAVRMLEAACYEGAVWSEEYAVDQISNAVKREAAWKAENREPVILDFSDIEWEDGEDDEIQGT